MITDIFKKRYNDLELSIIDNNIFVQLFNLYRNDLRSVLIDKVDGFSYSNRYADEYIRIIIETMRKLCNELGYRDLNKKEYVNINNNFKEKGIFENYIFDNSVDPSEKLSLMEILFRDTQVHLQNEIAFIRDVIPKYEEESKRIKNINKNQKTNCYDSGEEKLIKARPQLESKGRAIDSIQDEINKRLKEHGVPLSYHNGYFQSSTDPLIEEHVSIPFWELVSAPKYKNVERDMHNAHDYYDSNRGDPALYAAKALESMLKITCSDKKIKKEQKHPAKDYIEALNSKKNGVILLNEEKEELLNMFKIRHFQAHGAGTEEMPVLTHPQTLRYIHAAMIWILSLSKR